MADKRASDFVDMFVRYMMVVNSYLWKLAEGSSFFKQLMKILTLFCVLALLNIGCYNSKKLLHKKSFQSFDFSYSDVFSTCFSIKFMQSDTAYIKQHFASLFYGNLKSETSYYVLLSKNDRLILDSFINIILFANYDSSYYDGYEDGIAYQFHIEKDTIKRNINVHSDSVPLPLADFKDWIVKRRERFLLHELDTTIYFESEGYIMPPRVPPPLLIDFKVPKIRN